MSINSNTAVSVALTCFLDKNHTGSSALLMAMATGLVATKANAHCRPKLDEPTNGCRHGLLHIHYSIGIVQIHFRNLITNYFSLNSLIFPLQKSNFSIRVSKTEERASFAHIIYIFSKYTQFHWFTDTDLQIDVTFVELANLMVAFDSSWSIPSVQPLRNTTKTA